MRLDRLRFPALGAAAVLTAAVMLFPAGGSMKAGDGPGGSGTDGKGDSVKREKISTSQGPSAIGPYSQAIAAGDLVFVSGQIPIDPATGTLVQGDIAAQTDRVLRNLSAILEAAGASLGRVVKTTVYLTDLGDFEAMNAAYARHFPGGEPPARATVQVSRLPKGVAVEIDAIAVR